MTRSCRNCKQPIKAMADDYHWDCDPRTRTLREQLSALHDDPDKDAEGWVTIEVPRMSQEADARVTGLFVAVRITDPQKMLPIRVRMYMPSAALDAFSEVGGDEEYIAHWFEDVMLGHALKHAKTKSMVNVMCVGSPNWESYVEVESGPAKPEEADDRGHEEEAEPEGGPIRDGTQGGSSLTGREHP